MPEPGPATPASELVARLARRAASLVPTQGRVIIGITGPPGSGKSTLATAVVNALRSEPSAGGVPWVVNVAMDGFHLADIQLDRLGLRHRKGAPETFDDAGYAAILERCLVDVSRTIYVPGFERDLEQPIAASIAVEPSIRLVVTEGNYLLMTGGSWPRARATMAEVWYCDLEDRLRVARLVARHIAFGKTPDLARAFVESSDESNARLIESTRARADLIVAMS